MIGFDTNAAMAPTVFVPDTTPPRLLSWSFSFNTGIFALIFDEIIDVGFFNYSGITIVSKKVTDSSTYKYKILAPQYGKTYEAYSTKVNVTFVFDELNRFAHTMHLLHVHILMND